MNEERPTDHDSVLVPGPRARVIGYLRSYAGSYAELARHAARWMDLHITDTEALSEVLWAEDSGVPLSPARLSERTGLTSGATNALVNRLEAAGYLRRSREGPDRRIVTLRSTPTARERAEAFYRRPAQRLDAALGHLEPQTLSAAEAALQLLASTLAQINAELAEASPARPPT